MLPPYEVVIFDEAHQIEDVATEFFGVHASTQRLFALARDLGRETGVPLGARAIGLGAADGGGRGARRRAPQAGPGAARGRRRDARPPSPSTSAPARRAPPTTSSTVCSRRSPPGSIPTAARWPIRGARRRWRRSAGAPPPCRPICRCSIDGRGREHVRWLGASPRNVALHASPVDVGPLLGRALDACPGPIVLTSATLTVAGSFDYLRTRVGLGDTAAEASFPSPFSYARQALLYLAPDLPEPNQDDFAMAAAARMGELCAITGGRALLLFTSFKNLRVAEAHLRGTRRLSLSAPGPGGAPAPPPAGGAALPDRLRAAGDPELLGGGRRPGRGAVAGGDRQDPLRRPRRSADRRPHRPHPRRGGRSVRVVPAAARGAVAQAGVRPPHSPPRRPRHRRHPRRPRRAQELRRHPARQPAARLPAHRIAGGRGGVLGARAPGVGGPPAVAPAP